MFAAVLVLAAAANQVSSLGAADILNSPFSSDCFKRISIGERLIGYDVTRTVSKNTVKGCEEECNVLECTFFSFGIGTGGNGTCELSTRREISKRQATDYDLYQRTRECSQGKPTGYEEGKGTRTKTKVAKPVTFDRVCYRRLVSGKRLDERFIRHSLPCDTLEACQHQCSIEKHFKCQGFNIRYTGQKAGGGICELSSIPTAYLDPSRDFRYDPEFDYYEKDNGSKSPNCGGANEIFGVAPKENAAPVGRPLIGGPYYGGDSYGPWSTNYRGPGQDPWGPHGYGSGSYIPSSPMRMPTPPYPPNVATPFPQGLHHGPGSQLLPHDFHANEIPDSWNYGTKGNPYVPGFYQPPQRPGKTPTYIIIDSEQGGSFGGFDGALVPGYRRKPPPRPAQGAAPGDTFFRGHQGREVCFQRARVGYRLDPKFVRDFHRAPSVLDCEAMCVKSPFQCTGYSYRYTGTGSDEANCHLTDFASHGPQKNLLPDRSCDFYYKMPVCSTSRKTEDTECFLKTYSNQRIAPDKIRRAVFVRGVSDCELECLKSYHFTCRSFTFRYGPAVIGEPAENCFLSDWPVTDLHPAADFLPGPGCEVYERGSFGHGCELDAGPAPIGPGFADVGHASIHDKYHWNRQEMWRHFTVRGWPCRIGTQCQLNREAGFWSCEVEGGDRGQWDYCCKQGHQCGISRGYYYPWCYVGEASADQWRPCSEQFYPDFGQRYSHSEGHASNPHSSSSYGAHKGGEPWNYGQEEYGPPSYWPVLYLYEEPPPNETWFYEEPHHAPHHPQEHYDEDPIIRFRPIKNKLSHQKGIVIKIDLKDNPPASDPGRLAHKDNGRGAHVHPRYNYRKNVDVERIPPLGGVDCERQSLKAEGGTATDSPSNRTTANGFGASPPRSFDKSKGVIRDVEKIIREEEEASDRRKENATSGEAPELRD